MNYAIMWSVFSSMTWELTEKYPFDSMYKGWATRETLMKYYSKGMRKYTKW